MRAHTTSAVWVRGIASVLTGEGLDVRALLAAAAIDPAALDDPVAKPAREAPLATRCSTRRFAATLGVKTGREPPPDTAPRP